MPIRILVVAALCMLTLNANGTVVPVPLKASKAQLTMPQGEACIAGIAQGDDLCFVKAQEIKAGKLSEAAATAQGMNLGSVNEMCAGGGAMSAMGQQSGAAGASLCANAFKSCMAGCQKSLNDYGAFISACKSGNIDPQCVKAQDEQHVVKQYLERCKPTYIHAGAQFFGDAQGAAVAQSQYYQCFTATTNSGTPIDPTVAAVGNYVKDNAGKIAFGAGVLGLGYMAYKSGKDDGGGGGGASGGTGGVPDCTKADAAVNSLCHGQLLAECGNPANVGSEKCQAFTNVHCGFSATPESGKVNTSPGLGSQLCKDAMAAKYCKTETKSACYSCLNLKDRQSSACQENPASCQHQNSTQEMGYFKHQCPDDPVFTDPRWAGVVATALPANTPPPTTTVGMNHPAPGQPPVGQPPAITASTRVTASATGSLNAGFPDASSKLGPSVFSHSSQTVQALCQKGSLNNCGLRRTLK